MKKRVISSLLICFLSSRIAVANVPLLRTFAVGEGVVALPGSKNWASSPDKDTIFPLHYYTRVKPKYILIGRDHPNGIQFLAVSSQGNVSLPVQFTGSFAGFDEHGNLKPGYTIQIAEYRFTHDGGEPELVIAIGDGKEALIINVLRYHAPRNVKDAARVSNWTLEDTFSGQEYAVLADGKIGVSYGYDNSVWNFYEFYEGKFVVTFR